ncbi:hypothetical protein BUMB_04053c [Candidatus Paraburkholderia calva]|nr:hypothetical protein BUMB_04053c [Candidatus Paraburkholderia calva]
MPKIVTHLSSLFGMNVALLFFILCTTMFYFGGPINTVTPVPVTFGETLLYMCGVTDLTIGYGDIVPTTAIVRATPTAVALLGVLCTGLLTSAAVLAVQRAAVHVRTEAQ